MIDIPNHIPDTTTSHAAPETVSRTAMAIQRRFEFQATLAV